MSKLIILGHTGYVGKNIFDYFSNVKRFESIKGFSSKEIDLRNKKNYHILKKEITTDTSLIICAAIKSDNGNSLETFGDNIRIAENIALLLEEFNFQKIIVFSSNSVYGVYHKNKIINENTLPVLDTYYGLAKYMTENLFILSANKYNSDKLVILRPSTIYGPGELIIPHTPSGFLKIYLSDKTVTLWGDGSELREFAFIDDIVRFVRLILDSDFSGIINIGGGEPRSYADALEIIKKLLNRNIKINSKKRTTEPVNKIYDISLVKALFPHFKYTVLEKGLKLTYEKTKNLIEY